ncbi:hypothetical protein COOONC_20206 [Cooperia oncophora]
MLRIIGYGTSIIATFVFRYTEEKDFNALGWIKGAGDQGNTYSIRAEKGRRNLSEYNRKNNCHIKVVRDHTVHLSDIENISLYLRKRIRRYCMDIKEPLPDINVKNGYLTIKNSRIEGKKFKSTISSILLGWSYSDWSGTPIKELLTDHELKEFNVSINIMIV